MPDEEKLSRRRRENYEAPAVKAATAVTNLIKLGGLAIAGNEAILQGSPHDPVVFAVAAFMMAGAQGVDSFLNNFFGEKK